MAQTRVVICSSRSLFGEGIASRLRQHLGAHELQIVDARQTDALARVIAARPSAVILDATDEEVARRCPLSDLLSALPSLTVIRLDPQQKQVQVVTSEQRAANEASDLIDILNSAA